MKGFAVSFVIILLVITAGAAFKAGLTKPRREFTRIAGEKNWGWARLIPPLTTQYKLG